MFPIPTGFRAWIEDVIVNESARGRGIGAALTRKAIELAEAAGARTVDLTSRPSREAAGRLYERIGFAAPQHPHLPLQLRPPRHLSRPGWARARPPGRRRR